ncbi:hypothetical protein GGR92_000885 [Spirosoma lacussanchae]|uniref:hypothetical protein n=1 Tax=Spirosoma lacussanchae TaxID=1884249 RepID=UPI0011098B3C|nr:hypothetical protein [Spirosoma lacussanchae]
MTFFVLAAIYLFIGYIRLSDEQKRPVTEQTPLVLEGNHLQYILTWPLSLFVNSVAPKIVAQKSPQYSSPEIGQVLIILEQAKSKFGTSPNLNRMIDSIKTDVISDQPKWLEYIRKNPALIKNRVYQVILLDLEEDLSSGKYHAYRGLLGLEGRALFNIANAILDEFSLTNYWPESQVEEQKEILDGNMKNVG